MREILVVKKNRDYSNFERTFIVRVDPVFNGMSGGIRMFLRKTALISEGIDPEKATPMDTKFKLWDYYCPDTGLIETLYAYATSFTYPIRVDKYVPEKLNS